MVRRLPRGRTMGYGCPPPLAGGGVTPSNADTRVITALLTTATEGCREGMRAVRWGGHMYLHPAGGSNKWRNYNIGSLVPMNDELIHLRSPTELHLVFNLSFHSRAF